MKNKPTQSFFKSRIATEFMLIAALLVPSLNGAAPSRDISLDGDWTFELDRSDVGVSEGWFKHALPDRITLPGSLPAQDIGDPISVDTKWTGRVWKTWYTDPAYAKYREPGNVKVPFWLQPGKYYAGAAWYQRDIEIPPAWRGRRVVLSLERSHWETQVWLDGRWLGKDLSLYTPHEYDLGQPAPGRHSITVRVDNRMVVDIGENSHSVSDHNQGNWNGIVGGIGLHATPPVWIDDLQVYPNAKAKTALVRVKIGNATRQAGSGSLVIGSQTVPVHWSGEGTEAEARVKLGEAAETWDEFHPVLQHLKVALQSADRDVREVAFGLRDVSTQGTHLELNGRPIFIRGSVESCVFPKTGNPPMDVDSWRRIIGIAKAYGLNLLRFHSWCPPEAAFVAADELGFYFHVETCWANDSVTLGDGKPVDAWVYDETARILKAYGNHPSFLLMPYGNEPGGKKPAQGGGASQSSRPKYYDFLARYVAHFKALDSRRLWTSASGWPQIPENQFVVMPDSRIQPWGAGLTSRVNALPPETMTDYSANVASRSVPLISHEIGQWCVYPNFDEIPEYTGYLKPRNFEIFHDRLVEHHLDSHAREFLHASGKLQLMLYKEEIESQLRTPGLGGFELLALNDYPGEGTALVAVLDPFWNDKGYVTAREFSRFCNSTVLLARLQQRVFTTYQRFAANLEVANFGPEPLENAVVEWRLVDDSGRVFARGALPSKTVPIGEGFSLGRVEVGLEGASAPARLRFVVGIAGTRLENDWDVWVYPALRPPEPAGILLKSSLDDEARRCLLSGGKVLLTIPSQEVRNFERDPVKLGFSSIFWNTAWTRRQAPTTLGICCDPGHPLFRTFPTDDHSDWQWWYLIHRAAALRLDLLPAGIDPLVRVIDDWYTARPLGLIIEGTVGAGKIVVCGFDLTNDVRDPVSSQMRSSLLRYMNSDDFSPKTSLSAGMIEGLFFDSAENSGAHASE